MGQRCKSCGAVYLSSRRACSRCFAQGPFEEIPLSPRGALWVYSIVHQSSPGVPVPYVVGVVDLPEGVAVRCNIIDVAHGESGVGEREERRFGPQIRHVAVGVATEPDHADSGDEDLSHDGVSL